MFVVKEKQGGRMQVHVKLNWDSSLSELSAETQVVQLLKYVTRLVDSGIIEITGEPTDPLPLVDIEEVTFGTIEVVS